MNARIDDALSRKIEELRRTTGQSVTDILRHAIELYHESVQAGAGGGREALERSGFVGCAEGGRDLSTGYKSALTESMARKA